MHPPLLLQPTLWRTCRVLANHTRLKIVGLLLHEPNLSVSAVADRLRLPLSLASEYLRALEARGLLTASRLKQRVKYQPCPGTTSAPGSILLTALRADFRSQTQTVASIFRLATAFTHPRRIEIFRALKGTPRTLDQLGVVTGIPARALRRHVGKLEARGFVICHEGIHLIVNQPGGFGRALARLALE